MFGLIGSNHGINFNKMKELTRFREFLSEGQLDENKLTPAIIDFFKTFQPEEAPGSWDDVNNEFMVPYSYENLDYTEEDLLDDSRTLAFKERDGVELSDLPTEYVEFETYSLGVNKGKETTARNFAKFVPGEGLYYKITSEHK